MFVFYATERTRLIGAAALSAPGCCYSYCNVVVSQPVTFAFLWMLVSKHPRVTSPLPVAWHGSSHSAPSRGSKSPSHVTQWLIRGQWGKVGQAQFKDLKWWKMYVYQCPQNITVIWDFHWQSAHHKGAVVRTQSWQFFAGKLEILREKHD